MAHPSLELGDIQGDVLIGLQKNAEGFIFFKIVDDHSFKRLVRQHVIWRITSAQQAHYRELAIQQRNKPGQAPPGSFHGLNLGFTKDGMTQLLGARRARLDPPFERGADNRDTIEILHDPPASAWLKAYVSDRIDGVFLITGPNQSIVTFHHNDLLRSLGASIKVVYSEMGNTRPGA